MAYGRRAGTGQAHTYTAQSRGQRTGHVSRVGEVHRTWRLRTCLPRPPAAAAHCRCVCVCVCVCVLCSAGRKPVALDVVPAPEPSDIQYENLEFTKGQRAARLVATHIGGQLGWGPFHQSRTNTGGQKTVAREGRGKRGQVHRVSGMPQVHRGACTRSM